MEILSFLRKHGVPPDPTDELLYEFVAGEIASSMLKPGLWTIALTDSNWDEPRAKALYVKMRVAQLRDELGTEAKKRQALLADPIAKARNSGLSEEEIEYLGAPIEAVQHVARFGGNQEKLSKAISLGRIRAVLCRGVLWVQDKKVT